MGNEEMRGHLRGMSTTGRLQKKKLSSTYMQIKISIIYYKYVLKSGYELLCICVCM